MNETVKSAVLKLISANPVGFYVTENTQHYNLSTKNAHIQIKRVIDGKTKIDVIYLNDMAYLCSDRLSSATDYDVKEVLNAVFLKSDAHKYLNASENLVKIPAQKFKAPEPKPRAHYDDFLRNKQLVEQNFLKLLAREK